MPYPQRGPTDDNEEKKITALNLIRDGLSTAAELAALLFMAPIATAAAAESHSLPAVMPAATAEAPARTAERTLRPLHLVDGAVEMRLLGLLADLRVVQTVHNAGAHPVDLGARLRGPGMASTASPWFATATRSMCSQVDEIWYWAGLPNGPVRS